MSDSTTEHPALRRVRVRAPELIGKGSWLNTGVSATPPELLLRGGGGGADTALSRALELDPSIAEGVLHVSAMAASCEDTAFTGAAAEAEVHPACHVHQQDRGVPVRLTEGGTDRLPLVPAGMDEGL